MVIGELKSGQAGPVSAGLPWLGSRHRLGYIDGMSRQAQAGARPSKSLLVVRADLRPLGRSRHWRGYCRLIRQRERR